MFYLDANFTLLIKIQSNLSDLRQATWHPGQQLILLCPPKNPHSVSDSYRIAVPCLAPPSRTTTTGPRAARPACRVTATPWVPSCGPVSLSPACVPASRASSAASVTAATTPSRRSPPMAARVSEHGHQLQQALSGAGIAANLTLC